MADVSTHRAKTTNSYPSYKVLFLAWTLVGLLSYARHYLLTSASHGRILPDLFGWVVCYYPWVLLTPLVFRLERRFPLDTAKWPRHLGLLVLAGLPVTFVASEISLAIDLGIQYLLREPWWAPNPWWAIPGREFVMQGAIFWGTLAAGYIVRRFIQAHEQEQRAAQLALEKSQLESSLRQAEVDAIRMRLNPHFLFNSLQNISVLAQQDSKTASQMLTRLGDLLRSALGRDSRPETTLATEIALTQAYTAVEKMRFGDRLSVLFELQPGTEQALVPSFLLQPLVENAINHGLQGLQKSGVIWIRSRRELGTLVLTVADNGVGPPAEKLSELEVGVGLSSTCERLARMYPDQHEFSIRKLPEGGTEIRIVLPLRLESSLAEATPHEQSSLANR
jgi:two-component sensor histidine kinase